jgi:mannonate dehydratase
MNLGFGLYRHQLDADHLRFARQCGATHVVVHLVDYFRQGEASGNAKGDQPTGGQYGWGRAGDPEKLWSVEELGAIKQTIESHGLKWYAIENFDPAHWSDILLDGPNRAKHIENIKTIVRNIGKTGIPVMGYNFSMTGVYGRQKGKWARGDAESVGLDGWIDESPMFEGMAWNMRLRDNVGPATVAPISHDELWRRFGAFMKEVLPVAQEANVRLAAHPDDPPLPSVRGLPRLIYQPTMYDRLLDVAPHRNNALEYCLGTLTEMTERGENCSAVYEAVDRHSKRGAIAYVHFRNVRNTVPNYKETFIDEGDLDMARVLTILHRNKFGGVLIPDHTPLMSCAAPWEAGMAFSMGYIKSLMDRLNKGLKICAEE